MCFSKCRLNENPPIVGRKKQTKPLLKTHSYTHTETHTYTLMTRKGVGGGGRCDIPSFCLPCQPGRRFPPANAQQIHLLFISYKAEKARQTWQSYLPIPSPACADAITNVFPSAGDQYVWKQTNNPTLPGRLFPFSRPPLGALTADVHKRINKQRSSRVNTGHNQQQRIYTAKDDQRSPYVPYQGSTLILAPVPSCPVASRKQTTEGISI